jgi:cytochrome c oxidase subunit 3
MFLGTITMLFAAFLSAYLVRRTGSDWRTLTLPPIVWVNTALLIAVSAAIECGLRSARSSRIAPIAFGAAIVFGVLFLAGQAVAWRQLAEGGVGLSTSAFGAFVYIVTGAHAVHVIAAWLLLVWSAFLFRPACSGADARRRPMVLDACRTLWHFLGGLWLVLLAVLSGS